MSFRVLGTDRLFRLRFATGVAALLSFAPAPVGALRAQAESTAPERGAVPGRLVGDGALSLRPARTVGSGELVWAGTLEVPEDRSREGGRRIALHVLVLPCTGSTPAAAPLCALAGGPGQAATETVERWRRHPVRQSHDVLLVDQRGTGRSNPLDVEMGRVEDFSEPLMAPRRFREALPALQERADLTCYTSEHAAHDLDAVRSGLGVEQLSLWGGSYGTRMALVYMRRYPERVARAVLDGVAPIAFRNPLYHARSAQRALDLAFAEVAADPKAAAAFPNLERRFAELLDRLAAEPARIELPTANGSGKLELLLGRDAFASALRILLYSAGTARQVPDLLHRAHGGDLRPFARAALRYDLALRRSLSFGMLLCVTASEDLPRIDPDEIEAACAGTFLGDVRVRDQLEIAAFWPRGAVPSDYGDPVTVDVPTLVCSGTHDAVTPPEWGAEAARHLPNSRHLVVPGCHGVTGIPAVERLMLEFLRGVPLEDLDFEATAGVALPPIDVPGSSGRR